MALDCRSTNNYLPKGQRPFSWALLIALVLFVITSATQASEETCRSGCKGSPQLFKYAEGTTYKYNFNSKIEVSLSSAEGQKSLTHVKAQVAVRPQAQCNYALHVHNIQIDGNDGKKYTQFPDLDKPIRFNYNDGLVDDQLCIDPTDTQNSINIKRAIISMLQANLKSQHETDIFGACPTDTSQSKDQNGVLITKTRNLNKCAYREQIRRDFLSSAFNLNSEIKSSPLLNSDYSAKIHVKKGIIDEVQVHENYLYMPFSVGQNGAKINVESTLKSSGTSKDDISLTKCSQSRSIIFEDPHPVNAPHSNVNTILNAVKQTANTIDVTVSENTAKEFINLIKVLRVSNKDDQLAVYNQVKAGVGFKDKAAAKRIYLDALLRAGNGDNLVAAIELLKNKELSELEQKLLYIGLTLVRHPNVESLDAAAVLLNQPNLPREAYLGIGTLAGKFCSQHSTCTTTHRESINKLTSKLVAKLGDGKAANRKDENDIIFVLKALRNIHHLDDSILGKVTAIAQDKKQPNRLRVAALETYLADACKDKLRDSALSILKDIQQDSEVRIRAYLAAVQCPNAKVAQAIKNLLENEPSYQVGGYIVSHLRNARSSANPDKELIKQYLGNIVLPKRYPIDLRKWSANGEFSYSVDTLGLANSIEANVIYSQSSFLPRSTNLNLTAQIFGHNINFLELETRQENLDRLLEHYFGPKGLLRTEKIDDLWKTKAHKASEILRNLKEKLDASLRQRRDVSKNEIEQIGKAVQIKTNDLNKDLDLDLSIKAFGSELAFINVNDDAAKFTPDALINKFVDSFNKGLDRIKNFEETLRTNQMFLDLDISYPSSSGFPLRLAVEGAANVQVKAHGAIDIPALIKRDTTVKVSLIPSANIELSGRLTVDTWQVENGLKVITNLHTATGGDLIVQIFQNGVDIKANLPVEKQNLISVKHDVVVHTRKLATPEHNTPLKFAQNKDFSVCLDQLSPFIGLTFCAEVEGPNLSGKQVPVLPFPLAGDAKLAVGIERAGPIQYHYRHEVHMQGAKMGVEGVLETLGEGNKKLVAIDLAAFMEPEKFVKVALHSPITNAELEGRVVQTAQEKSLSLKLVHDQQEYSGRLGVAISGSADKQVYKPLVEYKTPKDNGVQTPPYHVEGQVIVETANNGHKYIFDNVKLIIPNAKTVTLNGNLGHEPELVYADLSLSDGQISGSFKGRLQGNREHIKYNMEVTNTYNPDAGIQLKGELSRKDEHYKNFIQVAHGRDLSNKKNVLTIENQLFVEHKPTDNVIETKNSLSYPLVGLSGRLDFTYKPKQISYNIEGQYNEVKLGSLLNAALEPVAEGLNYKAELDLWALENRIEVRSERKLIAPAQSQIANSLQINGKKFDVSGKIRHLVRPQEVDVGTDLALKSPTHPNPLQIISGLKVNANDFDSNLKIASGSTVYADAFLKATKAGNANGNIKVNFHDDLTINGQLKANKGVGKADLIVESKSAKKAAKFESSFTVHDPNYNIEVHLWPVYADDKNKVIVFSTKTKLTPIHIDSKNVLDLIGNKFEANLNCNHDENGKIQAEADLTLPNQHYFAGKVNRDMKLQNGVRSGHATADLEYRANKNQPGSKLHVKSDLKQFNSAERTIDVAYQVQYDGNGYSQSYDLLWKSIKLADGSGRQVEIVSKLPGTMLELISLKAECKNNWVGKYEIESSCPKHNLHINGQYDLQDGANKPHGGSIDLQLTTKSDALKTLKWSMGGTALKKQDQIELDGKLKVYADNKDGVLLDVDTDGKVQASDKDGQLTGSLRSNKLDPITVQAGYGHKEGKDTRELHANVGIAYAKSKNLKGEVTLNKLPNHEYTLEVKLDTPVEKFKSNKLLVHGKRSADNTQHHNDITLTSDGKTWHVKSDVKLSEIAPAIDVKVTSPEGKLAELLWKLNRPSSRQFRAEVKIVNQMRDFELVGDVDVNAESIDDFVGKLNLHSPQLKVDKFQLEASSKPAKTGRRIQITTKSGGKVLAEGSTSYTARHENEKLIIEGSGSFKVKDQTKSANFKFIKQNLYQDKNGENGIEISFDAGLGDSAIDAELKLTNKQFRILNSFCEEKKQCAHVEIDVKTTADDLHQFSQVTEIAIDLRRLGLSHEFGLKAVTNRKDWILDHTVDVHFQNQDQSKYQYSLYVHPRKAGASLTTPKRQIAIEANVDAPKTLLKDGGKLQGEVALYLNRKAAPNDKAALSAWLNIDPRGNSLDAEMKFSNPALSRPIILSGKSQVRDSGDAKHIQTDFVIDIFAKADQKILISIKQQFPNMKNLRKIHLEEVVEIKSSGLGINILAEEHYMTDVDAKTAKVKYGLKYQGKESVLIWDVSASQMNVLAKLYGTELLRITSKLNVNKDVQIVDTEWSMYGGKPKTAHLEVKNFNTLKMILQCKDHPNDKLVLNAGLIPGQIADARAELQQGGAKKDLAHISVKLDEANFLKSDYALNSNDILEKVVKPVKEQTKKQLKEWQTLSDKVGTEFVQDQKQIVQRLNNAAPSFTPLRQHYVDELTKIKDEIAADKTIRDISEFLHNILAAAAKVFGDSFAHLSELIENVAKSVHKTFGKLLEGLEKEWPQVKAKIQQFTTKLIDIADQVMEIVFLYTAKVLEFANGFQPEIQKLMTLIGDVSADMGKVLHKGWENIREVLSQQWHQIYNELKNLPVLDQIKAEYEKFVKDGLPISEAFLNTFHDIMNTVKDIAPTEELKNLIQLISEYIEKKLARQPVDDAQALDKIGKAILALVQQLGATIGSLGAGSGAEWQQQALKLPLPANILNKLPRLVAVRFSPLTYLLHEDLPDSSSFLLSLINHPRNWFVPFPIVGLIAQGQHIFTYDGKHVTFPGNCKYLLARDALDGNFTVIGTYTNGILTAITVSDGPDAITLKSKAQVLVNGKAEELPARRPTISAYYTYNQINIETVSGVHLRCGLELVVCSLEVNGFYHGKLRGLLGNGNNEPYDDFTMANGKIVQSESDFGNSYKIGGGCAPVKTVEHHHHGSSNPACDKLFGWESSLRLCYPFVKTENYKMACEHGLAAGVKDTEFAVAVAYVAACKWHNIPVSLPSEFVKCTNGDKPTQVGDKFSVKVPAKAVDLVLVVDTVKKNEPVYKEYIQPLIQQISQELSSKGINDVEMHLIAYGGENQWPSHVTTNGGKLTFKGGKAPQLKFSDGPKHEPFNSGCKEMDNVLEVSRSLAHDFKLAFGLDLQAKTYTEAINYPFRANALKSILVVTGNSCEKGRFHALQVLRTLLYRNKQINLNLITPFEKLTVDAKHSKDIVGFNSDAVFSVGAKKGKNEELRKGLDYNDYCVDFTVQNNGNVFVLDNFVSAKDAQRKQFVQTTSHHIVEQFTQTEQGLDCECKMVSPWEAANVCDVVSSKDKVPRKAGTKA